MVRAGRRYWKIFLPVIFAAMFFACAAKQKERRLPSPEKNVMFGVVFMPGANGRPLASQIRDMKDLGVASAKFWLDWNAVEPRITANDLTIDQVRGHPEIIEEYAHPEMADSRFKGLVDWTVADRVINELARAGISALPLIADATGAPLLPGPDAPALISPAPIGDSCSTNVAGETKTYRGIGRDQYLAHVFLFAAGLARRYSRPPNQVLWWNTENELNWTYIHASIAGWRCGKVWTDQKFLTDLLATLHKGVKAGNASAGSTMNLNIHDPDWLVDLSRWQRDLDAIGLGSYPNYLFAWPLLDPLLTNAVRQATTRSSGKPVFVLETGYPSGPSQLGWSEKRQAEYISRSVEGAIKNGAAAYFYFKLDDADLAIAPGSLQQVESHWGLVRVAGSRKPAFEAFKNAVRKFSGE
jgi:hypothetical protein